MYQAKLNIYQHKTQNYDIRRITNCYSRLELKFKRVSTNCDRITVQSLMGVSKKFKNIIEDVIMRTKIVKGLIK